MSVLIDRTPEIMQLTVDAPQTDRISALNSLWPPGWAVIGVLP